MLLTISTQIKALILKVCSINVVYNAGEHGNLLTYVYLGSKNITFGSCGKRQGIKLSALIEG